jgi:hypothetical protein
MSDPLQRGNMGVESHHYVCIYYFGLLGMISEDEVEKMFLDNFFLRYTSFDL